MSADSAVDPRSPRFAAWLTTAVLAAVLVNAVLGIRLGCQTYPLLRRLSRSGTRPVETH